MFKKLRRLFKGFGFNTRLTRFQKSKGEVLFFNSVDKFIKNGNDPSLSNHYNLRIWYNNDYGSSEEHKFYFDTNYGLILTRTDGGHSVDLGCLGFEPNKHNVSIRIVQLQGPTYNKDDKVAELLKPIKWERLLVSAICQWASLNGFESVEIQPASQNRWYPELDPDDKKNKFHMRYDVTARRLGFKFNSDRKVFVKPLQLSAA